MGFGDTLHFDEYKYRREHKYLSTSVIKKKLQQKTMQMASSSFGMGAGIGGAAFTGGLSLLGSAYSARQLSVLDQQTTILKEILAERDEAIPRERKRDYMVGAAIGVVALGIADVVPFLVEDTATSVVANATATTLATHAAPHVAGATLAQHGTIKAFESGVKEVAMSQLHAGAQTVATHAPHVASSLNIDPSHFTSQSTAVFNHGWAQGVSETIKAEGHIVSQATSAAANKGISKWAEHTLNGPRRCIPRFDEDEYRWENEDLNPEVINEMIQENTMQLFTSSFGVGAGIGGAFFTGGLNLFASAYSARRFSVLERLVEVLKHILVDNGHENPRERKRDIVAGAAIEVLAMGVADIVGDVASSVATHASSHVASTALAHHGTVKAFEHGVRDVAISQLHAGSHAIATHAPHAVSSLHIDPNRFVSDLTTAAYNNSWGYEHGVKGMLKLEEEGAHSLTEKGATKGLSRIM
ncbi:hypothetical protein FRC17_006336 [Serendipita sp. 399]|nr:hypothetical protein FRC17_006336 [Serendipita sp. 399]